MEALAALVQVLLLILFVGGLSLLAQWARKVRGAEIGLIVILLTLSLLVLMLGPIVGVLGVVLDLPPELSASSAVVIVLAGLTGLALCVPPFRKVTGRRYATIENEAVTPVVKGWGPGGRFSGGWWSDPPVFFALWMFVVVLAGNVLV